MGKIGNPGTGEGSRGTAQRAAGSKQTRAARVWCFTHGNWLKESASSGCGLSTPSGYDHVFSTFSLERTVEELERRKLKGGVGELAILAHGDASGLVKIRLTATNPIYLTPENVDGSPLGRLKDYLSSDGELVFFSCMSGQGTRGDQLLQKISILLPGRMVTAFTTMLWYAGDYYPALAGQVVDTQTLSGYVTREMSAYVGKPAMTKRGANAKGAKNGRLVIRPKLDSRPKMKRVTLLPAWLDKELMNARNDIGEFNRLIEKRRKEGKYYTTKAEEVGKEMEVLER